MPRSQTDNFRDVLRPVVFVWAYRYILIFSNVTIISLCCFCVCVCMYMCSTGHSTYIKVSAPLAVVSSFFPFFASWDSDPGIHSFWQVPLSAEPCGQPTFFPPLKTSLYINSPHKIESTCLMCTI